jgi:hypothetical protein
MVLFAPLVLAVAAFTPASRAKTPTTQPTPAYSPPPSEPSPFSKADMFCVPDSDQFETVSRTDPSLHAQPAELVWLAQPDSTSAPAGEAANVGTFTRLVNMCGGIGGRPLHVDVVRSTGDPATDCTAATRLQPLIVVSMPEPAAWSCLVHDARTILLTGSPVSNTDLTGAGGRLVATGSTEGVERARMLSLVNEGRFTDHKVAIVAGDDATGTAFRQAAESALATKQVKPVDLARADAVLTPSLDVTTLPLLVTATASVRRDRPLDVYGFDVASSSVPSALDQQDAATEARLLRSVNLYTFSPVTDPFYRESRSPNNFSQMCNRTVADAAVTRAHAATTTTADQSQPPLSASTLMTTDVCLLTRIAARGLFLAGPTPDQPTLIRALHRLPYTDQAAPSSTPKARPNQVVNEPVRRIEQVVVLSQLQPSCSTDTTTTVTTVRPTACWAPASGWNDGGTVVNVPLVATPVPISH